jgi:hypothetical protein
MLVLPTRILSGWHRLLNSVLCKSRSVSDEQISWFGAIVVVLTVWRCAFGDEGFALDRSVVAANLGQLSWGRL